jgi:hypothetical protein
MSVVRIPKDLASAGAFRCLEKFRNALFATTAHEGEFRARRISRIRVSAEVFAEVEAVGVAEVVEDS